MNSGFLENDSSCGSHTLGVRLNTQFCNYLMYEKKKKSEKKKRV